MAGCRGLWVGVLATVLGSVGCVGGDDTQTASETVARHTVRAISTISYAPNSFVIGNAYPGWTDDLHGGAAWRNGPGNWDGAWYQCGALFGEGFDHCGWLGNTAIPGTGDGNACGTDCPVNYDTPLFLATYTNGTVSTGAGDGTPTHMDHAGCADHQGYGNVEPWRVPATPHNPLTAGPVPDGKELLWRYVTRDGNWVMVRDPHPNAGDPNWYFVQRGCVAIGPGDHSTASAPPTPPAATPEPSSTTPGPSACGHLGVNEGLRAGDEVASCNGAYRLAMQGDGNLVLYQSAAALWATGTNGRGGEEVTMQSDGNLVVYTAARDPLWASHTNGHPGATLAVQDDGNLVIYDGATALWARFGLTSPPPATAAPVPPVPSTPAPVQHVCCVLCNARTQAYHANAAIVGGCAQAARDFCAINGRGGVRRSYEGVCPEAP